MGSKTEARERMKAAGVPIIPGTTEPVETAAEVVRLGAELGWPLAIKASAGGGGKGFRVVREGDDVERAFETARREGEAYFSNPAVYVERYLEDPRHVEVQLLADAHGNVIHLGERDCTIQRRHQKLVEETPSPAVDAELRARIGAIAVEAARAVGYRSAGHGRGFARSGRRLLLHGDEHAHPGRAHRHGAGHGPRPRPGAGADRGRRAAIAAPGGRPPGRARVRVPDQRGGSVRRLPADARADHGLPGAGWAGRTRRLGRGGRIRDLAALRPDDRQAGRARRRPGARTEADAAGAGRVPHRRRDHAARLPPRAAPPPVLRRRRHLPRRGGVGAAGATGSGSEQLSHETTN